MASVTARTLYIIAGEPSGDRLGGALMSALRNSGHIDFRGIGGQDMTAAGLTSLFEMSELTVMGLSEVLPKLRHLMRRISETAEDVIACRPEALITIDSPDFTLRVASRVRRALPALRVIHYVAPSVWAWRPGRAKRMARHVDHVLALLPFEPPYMQAAGMSCDFVGHPVAGRAQPAAADIAAFRADRGISSERKVLLVAPGSRRGEINRLGDDFVAAVALLRTRWPDLAVFCPVAETVRAEAHALLSKIGGDCWDIHAANRSATPGKDPKDLAFAASDAALCASGTIALELAAAGTPMVAAYRTSWLTAQIVRRVVNVNTANLVNLMAGRQVVPEFLQEYCTPDALAGALEPLLADPGAAEAQRDAFDIVMSELGRNGLAPQDRAAQSVLAFLNGERPKPKPGTVIAAPPGPQRRHYGRA